MFRFLLRRYLCAFLQAMRTELYAPMGLSPLSLSSELLQMQQTLLMSDTSATHTHPHSDIPDPFFRHLPDVRQCDIIGDVHGCYDELITMLRLLGHEHLLQSPANDVNPRLLFVGDIVDRGDRNLDCLRLVMHLTTLGFARMVMGNHDFKFFRWLKGHDVQIRHGLERTIAEFTALPGSQQSAFREQCIDFFTSIPNAISIDQGRLVVVHAAWKPELLVDDDPRHIRSYTQHGPWTGQRSPEGFPERIDWASSYNGPEFAVFGHQVYHQPYSNPYALGIDTGCVFGGRLTALRYPDFQIISVDSLHARAQLGR